MDTRGRRPDADSLEAGELYWRAIEPIWERISVARGPEVLKRDLAAVSAPQGLLFAAHWCQSEVCNGGLHQFFYNSTGVLAPEAVRGFEMLRVPKAARVIERAVAMFGEPYPRDHDARRIALARLERPGEHREQWDPFYVLDGEFYTATGTPEFADQADAFVRENLELFFR